jgi:hypothetical protein
MVAILGGICAIGFTGVVHAHWMEIIGVKPAHEHPGYGKEFNFRVIILGIKSPMLNGERFIVNFTIFDPVVWERL